VVAAAGRIAGHATTARTVTAVAAAAVVLVSGCSPAPKDVAQPTARVTVNGAQRTTHAVSCTQVQWLLTIGITAGEAGVTAVVRLGGDKLHPTSVNINNFDGFSGNAWHGGSGDLDGSFAGGWYTVTGTANGSNPNNPSQATTAPFRIDANCSG
jgi:ipoprotein LpqH